MKHPQQTPTLLLTKNERRVVAPGWALHKSSPRKNMQGRIQDFSSFARKLLETSSKAIKILISRLWGNARMISRSPFSGKQAPVEPTYSLGIKMQIGVVEDGSQSLETCVWQRSRKNRLLAPGLFGKLAANCGAWLLQNPWTHSRKNRQNPIHGLEVTGV